MNETNEKRIGEHLYRMRYWPPSKTLKNSAALLRVLGPSLAHLAEGINGAPSLSQLDLSAFDLSSAMTALVDRLDDSVIEALVSDLASYCEVQISADRWPRVKDIYESHFLGKPRDLFAWLAWGIGVQCGDFFGDWRERLAAAQSKNQASKSQTISAGPSGE